MRMAGVTRSSLFSHKVARFGATVVCLLSLFLLPGGVRADQAPFSPDLLGSIAGVVTDNQGMPLSNIEVSALVGYNNGVDTYYNTVRSDLTDAIGAYRLPVLPTGVYRLQFRDPTKQYALEYYQHANTPQRGLDLSVVGNHLTGVNTTLTVGGRITGTVTVQNELGVLYGNADIYGQGDAGWQIITSVPITQAGTYDSGGLLPGVYRVCVSSYYVVSGLRNCYGDSPTVQNATDITITAGETKPNLNIDLGAGQFDGVISGVVTGDGAPKAGIKVGLYYPYYYYGDYPYPLPTPFAYVLTDQAGSYTIGGLTAGQYQIGFSDPAGVYANTFFPGQQIPELATALTLQNSQVISNVNTSLVHGGKISGHVQRANGAPVANVLVQLYWQSVPVAPPILVPTATPFPFAAAATPTPTAPAPTPTPLPTPVYWQRMTSYYTKTDATGNYTLQGLWPDTYRLSFQLCPVYGYGSGCETEYYGNDYNVYQATDVKVETDKTITGINITLGLDHIFYLPQASR